jgi:hypothetical protein
MVRGCEDPSDISSLGIDVENIRVPFGRSDSDGPHACIALRGVAAAGVWRARVV